MSQTQSEASRLSTFRLVSVPGLISLAFTGLRLIGELRHWSAKWFSTETGGFLPSGMSWLIGITWLAVPFGVYFALKLAAVGKGRPSVIKAVGYLLLGVIILVGSRFVLPAIPVGFPRILIFIWLFMVIAASVQFFAWPALSRTLLAYGLAARIPVVVVMFFAMLGNWGTHYDYVGMPPEFNMSLWPRFLWLAFFPQLIFWVGFTIAAGSLSGSMATALFHRRPLARVSRV